MDVQVEKAGGVIVFGPHLCGKTTHAAALARHFGKSRIVDDWTPGGPVSADTLALTSHPHPAAIRFVDAISEAGIQQTAASIASKAPAPATAAFLFARAFNCPRDLRSDEYKAGVFDILAAKFAGKSAPPIPYELGTAQADAYFAGGQEGLGIWRAHVSTATWAGL